MVLIALVALVIVFSPYKSFLLVPSSDKFLVGRMAYIIATVAY